MIPLEPIKIGNVELKVPLIMAPMCGISDSPWRRIARRFGVGLVVTEMTSSEALVRNIERAFDLLDYEPEESPLVMQFCGSNPEVLAEAARVAQNLGAAMVDLNMGCPVRKIVAQGAGSALLLDLERVRKILRAMVSAVSIPVTLKLRAGWDENKKMLALDVAQIAEEEGVAALCIHARTRVQAFSGKADWSAIKALVGATKLPVIGNGDVQSPEDARKMMEETGCAGVMIGRGAQGRPWIFQEITHPEKPISFQERYETIRRHYVDSLAFYGKERGLLMMRKHLGWYSKGFHGGSHFRERVLQQRDPDLVLQEIDSFFENPWDGERVT